ncbi:Scramblase-domain-containing protein [Artomyces pyxidatus]|uniref:Scramblase-domain-containing protein n=1 Tax=Artomyces pyxidatus TaxID=48021 RepID=A0ACB8TAC2_9AGAM|nr:Scramblase-domain-containing protein [Artomyces pyxidatus]
MLRGALRHSVAPARLLYAPICFSCRSYALSRFPDRAGPTIGRAKRPPLPRKTPTSPSPSQEATGHEYVSEEHPSITESPLWEESQRPPLSNPEEGLKRLLLQNSRLVVTRQLEMMNILVGFEQTNRYVIANDDGETLGFIAEEPRGLLSIFTRQLFRTHRPFRAVIMDRDGTPILWIRRPFDWINSRMYVQRLKDFHEYAPDGQPVLDTFAEGQQRWHLWRRRYDLFIRDSPRRVLSKVDEPQPEPDQDRYSQFARIDEGFWAWHFTLRGAQGEEIASVNRAFRGFGREVCQYSVTFGPASPDPQDPTPREQSVIRDLTLEERALVLAMAVNVDFDYFSRHSEGG